MHESYILTGLDPAPLGVGDFYLAQITCCVFQETTFDKLMVCLEVSLPPPPPLLPLSVPQYLNVAENCSSTSASLSSTFLHWCATVIVMNKVAVLRHSLLSLSNYLSSPPHLHLNDCFLQFLWLIVGIIVPVGVGGNTKVPATKVPFAVDMEVCAEPIKGDERAPIKMVSGRAWSPGIYQALRLLGKTPDVAWERALIHPLTIN